MAEANPIIPPQFFTNLVERLRPSFFSSRHHGSPHHHFQGGLNPDFSAIRNHKRQAPYGAPPPPSSPTASVGLSYGAPSAPVGNSYGAASAPAPTGNSFSAPSAPVGNSYGAASAPAGDSYGSPNAPPVSSGDSYGSPAAPAISSGDSYGSPVAPVSSIASAPVQPQYGSSSNDCEVIRSLTDLGSDCTQGGQDCQSQCTTTQEQECSTTYEQQCRTVNEQVST